MVELFLEFGLELLAAIATAVVMFFVSRSIKRDDDRESARNDSNTLRHAKSVRTLGVGGGIVFFAAAIASFSSPTGGLYVALGFAAMGLAAGALAVAYFWIRFEITETGLKYRTFPRRFRFVPWSDVTAVRRSQTFQHYRIELRDGRVFRISSEMIGIERLEHALQVHVGR